MARRNRVVVLSAEARNLIDRELGFVASVSSDCTPNLSPKGTVAVWDDEHIVFADLRSPGTVANLRANPSVEVNVVDPLTRKGFRIKGKADVHDHGHLFEAGVSFYERRGTIRARERIRSIVLIAIERVLPVTSPAYDVGLTESDLRKANLQRLTGELP